jgi:type IV pilus assembly protein PilV
MMSTSTRKNQTGSFILEALISVVIFAVGLIALVGMSAQAINQISQTKYRNDASYLASELIGSLWVSASPPNAFDYDAWTARVQAALPGGDASVGDPPDDPDDLDCKDPGAGKPTGTRVCVKITWTDKENAVHQYLTTTEIAKN